MIAIKLVSEARQQGMQLTIAQVLSCEPNTLRYAEKEKATTTRSNAKYKSFSLFFKYSSSEFRAC